MIVMNRVPRWVLLFVGILLGLGLIPPLLTGLMIIALGTVIVYYFWLGKYNASLPFILCLLVLEPYFRAYIIGVPYLFNQYLLIILAITVFLRRDGGKWEKRLYFFNFLLLYFIIELFDVIRAYNYAITRSVLINTFSLLSACFLGLKIFSEEDYTLHFIRGLSNIGLLLVGIVLAGHLSGEIEYGTESSFMASNGLAPVQLSYYLSLVAISLFITIKDEGLLSDKLLILLYFGLTLGLMVLTFSRGGLYFVLAYLIIYLFLNRQKIRGIFFVGVLFVLSVFALDYFVEYTNGKIIERYSEVGLTNRDKLVSYGLAIFYDNMLAGVGTGNYHSIVSANEYFGSKTGSHNEFIRSLSEHGILGLITFGSFLISTLLGLARRLERTLIFMIVVILFSSFLFASMHNGLKLGLQEFVFVIISGHLKRETINMNK